MQQTMKDHFYFETRLWRIENRCRINEPVQFFIAYGVLQLLIHGFVVNVFTRMIDDEM